MKLSIIIVSWKAKEKLRNNLDALLQSSVNFNYEVFVVDNNSGDGTEEMVINNYPNVKYIQNNDNVGFSKANNQVIKNVHGEYMLLLNPDMKVNNDTLALMIAWMDKNRQAKVAGCKLINDKGEVIKHVRRFPRLLDQLAIVLKLPHLVPSILDSYIVNNFDYTKDSKVDSIRGSFFMIRNDNDLKFLDERYFIWFEEVDFCREVYKSNGEVWYTSVAECLDYVGHSFNQVSTGVKQGYFKDSQIKYFKKWHSGLEVFFLKVAWIISGIIVNIFKR